MIFTLRGKLYALALWSLLLPAVATEQAVGGVTLVDQNGRDFQLASLHGSVVLLVFGFTNCPHICPVEMARVSAALYELERYGDRVQGIFITVDPDRDTPEVIKVYLKSFHPDFIGLSGTESALTAVADRYRVKRAKIQAPAHDLYLVDHGYSLYILNQQGEAEVLVLPGLPPQHIVSIVSNLLDLADH